MLPPMLLLLLPMLLLLLLLLLLAAPLGSRWRTTRRISSSLKIWPPSDASAIPDISGTGAAGPGAIGSSSSPI
jgi:hypothetical protein